MKYGEVKNIREELLSNNWHWLKKVSFDYRREDGSWEAQVREVYDRGNGAVVLLYNTEEKSVVLTRQFRMPTYYNGNPDGMMVEACAGILEDENPEKTIIKEIEEETGYRITQLEKVLESYMSPGSVTEILHFYLAPYAAAMKVNEGGGVEDETENIEVLEMPFQQALDWVADGQIKDAKTILLLQYAALHKIM